ncbi:MAG: bifunctional methylenetetrahydrofolate dehydrogenase/methenyltetrahydrofolate cyclohydrolase FolD [bacterium]|nr:bifunctional methylenetetrahydrofolate dehydrogenase/methenyltetrahydrofolate cyclohydrolase FolD [bacterium]
MSATIIDGKATADSIRRELAAKIAAAVTQGRRPPGLAVIIVGEDPASQVYVRSKSKLSAEAGFHSVKIELPANIRQEDLLVTIGQLNADPLIDGILCQLPLPGHLSEDATILALDPDKDVDGLHPVNAGRLATGLPGFVPCTPLGCKVLLQRYDIPTEGRRVVILGRSNLVGTPLALLMMQKAKGANATVTVCHSRTKDLAAECARADILVAAIGRPRMVTAEYVKEGAVVIDVGINRIDDPAAKSGSRLVGDVDYDAVMGKVSAITPVPGGVGPMTIAMLLANTVQSWERRLG